MDYANIGVDREDDEAKPRGLSLAEAGLFFVHILWGYATMIFPIWRRMVGEFYMSQFQAVTPHLTGICQNETCIVENDRHRHNVCVHD